MIARGHGEAGAEWRARWRASTKTGSPLFEGATTDWNINQVALVFWSNFYDNIYEHPERPSQKVIDNDDLLDKWCEDKAKEMEERSERNSKSYRESKALAYDEAIIFDDSDLEYQRELIEYEESLEEEEEEV